MHSKAAPNLSMLHDHQVAILHLLVSVLTTLDLAKEHILCRKTLYTNESYM
jgi:hypothetical protein